MMSRKKIVRYVLLILCVFVLFIIPWTSVIGIQDPGLIKSIGLFQRTVGFLIVTSLIVKLVYLIYGKSLRQEMKKEETKEAHQIENKQLLFKPTTGVLLFFLFLIFMGILCFYFLLDPKPNGDPLVWIICSPVMIGVSFWLWYNTPVFIFGEDSVQIKSFLFYFFRIDRKTVIKYADITSVRPDTKYTGNYYGRDSRYRIVISMGDMKKICPAPYYNSDIIAKLYLRFQEKLGDKVKLL